MRQNVFLQIDAGRNLDQLHAIRRSSEYAPLSHIEDRLSGLGRVGAAEGDLLNLFDEFLRPAFPHDGEVAVCDSDLEAACGKCAREQQLLGVL